MSIKSMSMIVLGSILLGVLSGFLASSIVVGVLLPVLLIVFYVMWKYMKSESPDIKREEEILEGVKTVKPQETPVTEQPTYYQDSKDRV